MNLSFKVKERLWFQLDVNKTYCVVTGVFVGGCTSALATFIVYGSVTNKGRAIQKYLSIYQIYYIYIYIYTYMYK